MRTNSDRLDPDTLLDVGAARVVGVLVREDGLAAEGVDKGGSAWWADVRQCDRDGQCGWRGRDGKPTSARGAGDHEAELDSLLDILLLADHLLCQTGSLA